MPNIHSAVKRMRVSEKARQRNKAAKSKISTLRRQLFEVCAANAVDKSRKVFSEYCSILDKAAIKGIIKKNTANRKKSRLVKMLNKNGSHLSKADSEAKAS